MIFVNDFDLFHYKTDQLKFQMEFYAVEVFNYICIAEIIFYYFLIKMVDYLKKALIHGHTSRISSRIYYQFTTFEGKSLDMPPGTLQAQTSAHSIEKE